MIKPAERVYQEEVTRLRRAAKRGTASVPDARLTKLGEEVEQIRQLMTSGTLSAAIGGAALERAEAERQQLLQAADRSARRKDDAVVNLRLPAVALRFRQLIDCLPETILPPAERQEARSCLHEMLGRVLVEDRGPKGVKLVPQVDAAFTLLKAAGAEFVSNPPGCVVAGARSGRYLHGCRDAVNQ